MKETAKDLVAEANKSVETLSAEEDVNLVTDPNVVMVYLREGEELQTTGVQGAVHVPRGFLEFHADPRVHPTRPSWAAASAWCSTAAPAAGRRSRQRP